jgi:hypothetical protein
MHGALGEAMPRKRKTDPEVGRCRARLAGYKRHHPDADHTELELDLREANVRAYILEAVDPNGWPPLRPETRAELAQLLAPSTPDEASA